MLPPSWSCPSYRITIMHANNHLTIRNQTIFCSSSLGLVTLISMVEIQDGCTVIKVYCNLGNHNIPMHSVNTTQHTHTHTGMFMVQTEDFSLFSHCLDIVFFSDVPIGFEHKIYRGLSPV